MPRYFFHVKDGADLRDAEGTQLDDLAAAKCEAVKYAGRLICDEASHFWDRKEWMMTVADASGLMLFQLHFIGIEAAAGQSR